MWPRRADHRRRSRAGILAAAGATLIACLAPGVASAQDVGHLNGSPVDVYADGLGRLQFRFDGRTDGLFFPPDAEAADAGLEIVEGDAYIPLGAETRQSIAGPTVNPGTITSTYDVSDNLRVQETVSYTNGSRFVDIHYEIVNRTIENTISVRAGELADLYVAGSDAGTGVFDATEPRFVGGRGEAGVTSGLVEVTPWAHYQEGQYGNVFSNFGTSGLTDTVDPELVDNGVGAEWAFNLPGGATEEIDVRWSLEPVVAVTTTTDDMSPGTCTPAGCTLREALASTPGTVIVVPPGNYTLAGALQSDRDLTIQGAGPTTRIIASPNDRVLRVTGGSLIASGVEITGGNTTALGGGVLVDSGAALRLVNSTIRGNTAPSGGGIWTNGTLELLGSTIDDNNAIDGPEDPGRGGGIGVGASGVATVENSTVSGNFAATHGGGIYTQSNLVLRNATIAANSLEIPTIGNGGGIRQDFTNNPDARTVASNALVVRNTGGNCGGTTDPYAIQSTHGMSDDQTCNAPDPSNIPVTDAKIGPLANNGGPTRTHALLVGSPAIDAGDDAACFGSDQRGIATRGVTCDIGAFEYVPSTPPSSPGKPRPPIKQPPQQLPPPVAGESGNVLPASGTVKVKLPGTNKFVVLAEGQQIPMGTIVDTRNGSVRLVVASNKSGGTSTALFSAGVFKLSQSKGAKPITTLTLVEKLSCPRSGKASAAAKRKKKRRLWGDGKGRFRTKGKHSAATVLGTRWLVEDRCTSTLTRVVRGKVSVRDFARRKTVVVRAGKKYLAKRR